MTARVGAGWRYCQLQIDKKRYPNLAHGHNPRISQETQGGFEFWHPLFFMASQQTLELLSGHNLHVACISDVWLEHADLVVALASVKL